MTADRITGAAGSAGTPASTIGVQFVLDGETLLATLLKTASGWRVEVDGERFDVPLADIVAPSGLRILSVTRGATGAGAGSGQRAVKAPMAGRLVAVSVVAGQKVKAGDVLFVLEAMKMQNEVRSPAAGTVHAVLAAPGSALDAGTVVLEIA